MTNPNNNKHFNDEALRINRMLKKENDALRDALVYVIQTLDEKFYDAIQDKDTTIGGIRHRVDQALYYRR